MSVKCKRLFSLLLALALIFSLTTTAFAAEAEGSSEPEPTVTEVLETEPEPTPEPEATEPPGDTTEPTEPAEPPTEEGTEATMPPVEETQAPEVTEPTEATEPEPTLDPVLADAGFVSDVIEQKYVGLEDPGDYGFATFTTTVTATLKNCDQMDMTLSNGTRQGFHIADEDGKAPWDNMNLIFCLEPNKSFSLGSGHEGSSDLPLDGTGTKHGEKIWYGMSLDQRTAIAMVLLYGAPTKLWDDAWGINPAGDQNVHNPNIGYRFATQAIIWELASGMRGADYPYTLKNSYWLDLSVGQCTSEDGTVDHFLYAYNSIVDDMLTHNVLPSFTGATASAAPEISLSGNAVTVTDDNGVLPQFTFTNRDTVSFRKNGNKLTITASGAVTDEVHRATATFPDPEGSLYEVWYNQYNSSMQTCIKVSVPETSPVSAYFKLKASTGDIALKKDTEDGKNKGGWQFYFYADQACTQLISGPHTTDAAGDLQVTGLTPGVIWVKETGHSDPAIHARYICSGDNPQKVTITSGDTAAVSFYNKLRNGYCQIIKELANPEAGTTEGHVFIIHKVLENGSLEYMTTATTGPDGSILQELEPGTYRVTEELPEASLWECISGVSQTVTVEAGQTAAIRFTNALRPGELQAKKVNPYGEPLAGVVFLLEWSNDGESWQPVSFTDDTIPIIGGCTTENLVDGKLVTDKTGVVTFQGLYPTLQYRLTEVSTVDGYMLLTGYAYEGSLPLDNDLTVTLRVVNAPVFTLPKTGGNAFWYLPVMILLCGGIVSGAWVSMNRKRNF